MILPPVKTPFICTRVGDPQWVESQDAGVSLCTNCLYPVHITKATQERADNTLHSFIICINCVAAHNEATGRKFVPVNPDESQMAEGNPWRSSVELVVCQRWAGRERGWGQRPDGFSLHLSEGDRVAFLARYWSVMPDTPPDEYSHETGEPYNVGVGTAVYEKLTKGPRFGLRSSKPWPEPNTVLTEC